MRKPFHELTFTGSDQLKEVRTGYDELKAEVLSIAAKNPCVGVLHNTYYYELEDEKLVSVMIVDEVMIIMRGYDPTPEPGVYRVNPNVFSAYR